MLNLLKRLIVNYQLGLSNQKLERRQLIQTQLDEAEDLLDLTVGLLEDIDEEVGDLKAYLNIVTAEEEEL
jgi:hypothetical protein